MTSDMLNAIGLLLLTFYVLRLYGKNRTRIQELEYKIGGYEFTAVLLQRKLRELNEAEKWNNDEQV